MYLSWKGVITSTIFGAGVGAGIGAAMGSAGKGAGIGAAAGMLLPPIAEGFESMFDGDRADATTALKHLRSAIVNKDPTAAATAKTEFDNAFLKLQAPPADKAAAK